MKVGLPWEKDAFLEGGKRASPIFHHCYIKEDLLVAFKTKCSATRFEPGLIKVLFAH